MSVNITIYGDTPEEAARAIKELAAPALAIDEKKIRDEAYKLLLELQERGSR